MPWSRSAELEGEVRHVDGSGGAVDHGDRDQEQHRGHHGDHHVGHAGPDARARPAQGDEDVAGGQQDLEADVEVEEVPGEEGVGHPGHQDQVGRVEDRDRRVAVAVGHALSRGVDQHREAHGRGHHEHQRGELVHHHHDAPGRQPAADVHRGRPAIPDGGQQPAFQQQGQGQDGDADRPLGAGVPDQQEGQGGAQNGEYDGERGKAGDVHFPPPSGLGVNVEGAGLFFSGGFESACRGGHRP